MGRHAGPNQLPLDFTDSSAQRRRRAKDFAAAEQSTLFETAAIDIDVHLHSPTEAVAVLGGNPDITRNWLERIVGPVDMLKSRRVTFDVRHLAKLHDIRPPAKATLDAASLAVARAQWAHALGYRPLRVQRRRTRLIASSTRWPAGLNVADVPWTSVLAVMACGIEVEVDPDARNLLNEKAAASGQTIATASLGGNTAYIDTQQPQVLEGLGIPALAYAGGEGTGRYRLPLLCARPLLDEPTISVTPELATAIKRATGDIAPLDNPPGFPWNLYPFQARDAAKAMRILETSGGVLLAGDMGSGKALRPDATVFTPSGPTQIGTVTVGDQVLGRDGDAHTVTGVYRHDLLDMVRVRFSDNTTVDCCTDHLWAVSTDPTCPPEQTAVLSAGELADSNLHNDTGNPTWFIPIAEPLHFTPADPLLVPAAQLGTIIAAANRARGNDPAPSIPHRYLYGTVTERTDLLNSLIDPPPAGEPVQFVSRSAALVQDVAWLVRSLGGIAHTDTPPPAAPGPVAAGLHDDAPRYSCQLRLRTNDNTTKMGKAIVNVEPIGQHPGVCITVDADDSLYVTDHAVVTHNTTVGLSLVSHLETWPLLVVSPLAAFSTWARQLGEMGRTFYLASEPPKIAWERIKNEPFDAVVISYDRLHAFVELLETLPWGALLADELQRISSPGSQRSRALRTLAQAVPLRIGLSGTPISNTLGDVLPLGAFLVPGEWKPRASAKDLADLYPGDPVEAVAEHLSALMVRRRMEDTGVTLPEKTVERVLVALTPEQRRAIEDLQRQAEEEVEEGETNRMHVFAKLQRLRRIVACPSAAGVSGPNPKVQAAVQLAQEFNDMGRKSVLFCADRTSWRELGDACTAAGLKWTGIWGSSSVADRLAAEKQYHTDDDTRVFIGTLQSCAESLTLSPTGTAWITTSYLYNPSALAQAEARIYRLNQTNPTSMIYLHSTYPGGSLDDRMVEILETKRQLIAQVVDRRIHTDTTNVHYALGDLVYLLTGKRNERIDQQDADKKAAQARELKKKELAKATAHRRKYKTDTSVVHDDGSYATLLDNDIVDGDVLDTIDVTGEEFDDILEDEGDVDWG
jgi:hypothetical protein